MFKLKLASYGTLTKSKRTNGVWCTWRDARDAANINPESKQKRKHLILTTILQSSIIFNFSSQDNTGSFKYYRLKDALVAQ